MKTLHTVAAVLALLTALPGLAATAPKAPPKHTSTLGTHAKTLPTNLKPGEYLWIPHVSPKGPVVMIVSLPEQRAYVYRNGLLIGASTVSTGKKGYETPTGVFTILQKREDHYSNLYNDAPMPYMQRLTWSGVALHAGRLPGYPASHGCVRMPYDFAQKLYGETKTGLTVVVSDENVFPGNVAYPGLVAPVDATGKPVAEPVVAGDTFWRPEASPTGPVTILITNEDKRLSVFRGGIEIGRTPVTRNGPDEKVTLHVLTRLEPSAGAPLDPRTGQPVVRWQVVSGQEETSVSTGQLLDIINVPPDFLRNAATMVGPGTTLVITQAAADTSTRTTVATDFAVVTADQPPGVPAR